MYILWGKKYGGRGNNLSYEINLYDGGHIRAFEFFLKIELIGFLRIKMYDGDSLF